ncbi:MAG: hypothetical protein ABIV39_18730, partial [Verrucomicrobiota bacterium]
MEAALTALVGINNLSVVETLIKRIGFRIDGQFLNFPFMLRSKCTVTIFSGLRIEYDPENTITAFCSCSQPMFHVWIIFVWFRSFGFGNCVFQPCRFDFPFLHPNQSVLGRLVFQ